MEILAQVARALDYAHSKGRVHRDIKPSNILIEREGRPKVSDFGVAKIMTETHTTSGHVLGTPAYMSPEQVRDEPLDGRSDLFSLGAVLYQCLTGILPFPGDSLVQVVYKILKVDPRPMQLPRSPATELLVAITERALQKDAASRYQTGEEFAQALTELQELLQDESSEDLDSAAPEARTKTHEILQFPRSIEVVAGSSASVTSSQTVRLSTAEMQLPPPVTQQIQSPHATAEIELQEEITSPSRQRRWLAWLAYGAAGLGLVAAFTWLGIRALGKPAVIPTATEKQLHIPNFGTRFQSLEVPVERSAEALPDPPPSEIQAVPTAVPRAAPGNRPQPSPEAKNTSPQPVASQSQVTESEESPSRPVTLFSQPLNETSAAESDPVSTAMVSKSSGSRAPAVSVVELHYRHRNEKAHLSVLVDGEVVWSELLRRPINPIAWAKGKDVMAIIPVPEGQHSLEVRVSVPAQALETSRSIRSHFTSGSQRVLKVTLNRKSGDLRMRWKE
jgi:serine/threonine protein kinase